VLSELKIRPKQVVADIGAGTGYFWFRIAKAEPSVKVFAAYVQKELVDYLAKTAKERAIPNVIPIQINASIPNLPEKIDHTCR
jgi:tRNA G46 methylase TrmB